MMSRPNFVLFMPDQLRADAVGCFGNPIVRTPAVDALAARGVRFTDAWSQHSVCGPSRVSMMTGWYPHVHGHRTLDHLLHEWEPNVLRQLKDAGYYVAVAGNRGDVFAPGVTEASSDFCGHFVQPSPADMAKLFTAKVPEGSPLHRAFYFGCAGDEPVVDMDEQTIRTAERWLAEGAPSDRPWVLWVPLLFPHPPFVVEEPYSSMYDRAVVPAAIPHGAAVGKARFMEAYRHKYGWDELTDADFREITATYYGMVSRVDSQLARVVQAVDAVGATDNTVFAFFTDHGEYLGDHGLVEKWPSGLDASLLRNPLVLAGGGLPAGITVDRPVEMIDLTATLLDLGRVTPGHTHFGRSLVPVMNDPTIEHRPFACSEGGFRPTDVDLFERAGWLYQGKSDLQHEHPELVGTALVLRTPTHTYVHRRHESDELYDRVADPQEIVNLHGTPGTEVIAADLRDRLFGWLADTSDVFPWKRDPRFPEIQHGWRERVEDTDDH